MAAATIDFGIDLGVTNSRIAVASGGAAQVVLNGEGLDATPTAVWCDERERLVVGSQTRDHLVDDPANVADRFKLQLGTDEVLRFARQNRPTEPEDLATEVIGSLRADARRRTGREVSAAVLTAPTGFTAVQRDALVAAARKAGVAVSLLLQEPLAAAFAYGAPAANACWLVYDFGGVGFEAALVALQDGVLQVTHHAGDARLGGDLLDWAIVDKLLVPAVAAQFAVKAFRRDNAKWRIAIAKLKMAAEEARIRLDRESSAPIVIPFLCRDDSGAPVRFRHTLTRSELDALLEPVVGRSLKVCERLLAKRDLGFDDLERIVVCGGPARDPAFARLLAEQGSGLGGRVAGSVDPFTAVVQGAALYAGSEPVERAAPPVFVAGQEVVPEPQAEALEEIPVAVAEAPVVAEVAAVVAAEAPVVEEAPEVVAETAPVVEETPSVLADESPTVSEPVEPPVVDAGEPVLAGPEAGAEAGVEPQAETAPEVTAAEEGRPVSWEPEWPAPLPDEPAAAEEVEPQSAASVSPEEPSAVPDAWGAPGERETDVEALAGTPPVADEHAASEEWRPVAEEMEAGEIAARARETELDGESAPEWALEVEKREPAPEEEAEIAQEPGEAWDLVPEDGSSAGADEPETAEPVDWAPVEQEPLVFEEHAPPAEEALPMEPVVSAPPVASAEPVMPASPSAPLPPRTGAPGGTLEETIVARATSLVKAGRHKDAKRLVDRLGPTETLSVQALDLLVAIYTHEGQFDAAERVWRRAAGLDPAGHKGEPSLRRAEQRKTAVGARRANGKRRRVPPSVLAGGAAGIALIVVIVLILLLARGCHGCTTGVVASASPTAVASRTTSTSPSVRPTHSASPTSTHSASPTPTHSASPTATPTPTPSPTGPPALSLQVPGARVTTQGDALEVTFDHGLFTSGSGQLTPSASRSLLALAQQLRPHASRLWVLVTGHTDDVPVTQPFAYPDNVSLGMARAVAVVEFFRSQGGLPYVILSARSVDARNPLGSNTTAAGRARNRTVVIAVTRRGQ